MSEASEEAKCGDESPVQRYQRLRTALQHQAQEIYQFVWAGNESHVLLSDLADVIRDLEDDSFKIGLFGVTAAGKSTLTNALLRDSILREGLGETTRTLTKICAADRNHPHGTVLIEYKTLQGIHQELEEHLRRSGFGFKEGLKINLSDPAFRADLRAILRNNRDRDPEVDITCRYIKHLLDGWDKCEALLGTQLSITIGDSDKLVHDQEDVATYINERIIYHDNEITKDGFTFFDAPGIGSSYARHTQEAVSLARRVDAAILVTKVDYKFMPPDRRFVRDALDVQRMQDRHNLVFVLNQISRINPLQSNPPRRPDQFGACVAEEVDRLCERLTEVGIHNATVFPLDAASGRWTRSYLADPKDEQIQYNFRHYSFVHCKGNPEANLKASGLPDFEEGLIKHLTSIRYYSFLANKLDRLEAVNGSYEKECKQALSDLNRTLEDLEKELAEHLSHSTKVKDKLSEYLHYTMPAKVNEQYRNLSDEVSSAVDKAFEILAKHFTENYHHKSVWNQERYWAWVVDKSASEIEDVIATIRDQYESKYSQIRDEALRQGIPEIVARYGPQIDWNLNQNDLSQAIRDRIQGLSRIQLDWWQKTKAIVFSWGTLLGDAHTSKILQYLKANYQDKFREDFSQDITGWVNSDQDCFRAQVLRKFDGLMKQIEDRINAAIYRIKDTEPQREAAETRFKSFITKCHEVDEGLRELEQEIEKARPTEGMDGLCARRC
ncbi:MAG: dynamin family protein [Desulfomonilaceae bacterium]